MLKKPSFSFFPTLMCVILCFLSFNTDCEPEQVSEGEDLPGMSWIPSETTRLCVAPVSLHHGNVLGLVLSLYLIVVVLLCSGFK